MVASEIADAHFDSSGRMNEQLVSLTNDAVRTSSTNSLAYRTPGSEERECEGCGCSQRGEKCHEASDGRSAFPSSREIRLLYQQVG
jgi:hypothetical protein